jgi:hypothetical protein
MIFVKVIVCILLYLALGIGIMTLIGRLNDDFNYGLDDPAVMFGSSTIWPLILLMFLCKVFTEKVTAFWNWLIDKIEARKEIEELEEEDEYR